jgi:RimJ/RimL family protein N-acetyltransferase
MKLEAATLEGQCVRLEPMREDHADGLVAASLGHGLFRYYPFELEREDLLRNYVKLCVAARSSVALIAFATLDSASGAVIGSTSFLAIDAAHKRLEIGATWLTPAHQRTRANTEAKYLQLRHCFEIAGANRVEFKTDARNEKSRAALLRLGAVEEGTFRSHMVMPDGALRDSVYFSVIAPEWPAVKRRLEAKLASA